MLKKVISIMNIIEVNKMKLIVALSPSCGAKLDVNSKEETVVCKYC